MNPANTANRNRAFLLVALSLAVFVIGSWTHFSVGTYSNDGPRGMPHVSGMDDAYISYRYGWNLVHFHTLSWNESGFRRTEGFSNPLWMYISAAWSLFGQKLLIYPGMVLTSVLITAILIAALSVLALKQTGTGEGLTGILLLCGSPIIWLQATSGLEATVFGAAVGLLAFYAITNDQSKRYGIWFGNLLAAFVILLRSDGFAYVAVLLLALLIARPRNIKMVAPGGITSFVLLLVWREGYFGQLLPNTEVAKLNFGLSVRLGSGVYLFAHSMLNGGVVFLVAGLLGIVAMPRSGRVAALITAFGWCSYYVYIGGDLFLERHLIGVMVLCAALAGYFFGRLLQDARGWILVGFLLTGLFVPFYIRDPRFLYLDPRPRDSWILVGQEMALHRQPYGTVVTGAAGKIPFFAGGDFVDELGLNDPELAGLQRNTFLPGHSAGSRSLALEIARQASPRYSYVAFNLDLTPDNARDVLIWADNSSPQAVVVHGLSSPEKDILMQASPLAYTLVFRGNRPLY